MPLLPLARSPLDLSGPGTLQTGADFLENTPPEPAQLGSAAAAPDGGEVPQDEELRSLAAELKTARRLLRRTKRRQFLDALRIRNAAKELDQLPPAEHSTHCIMRGNFNGWDLVPAILRLLPDGEHIAELWVATLGFNRDNATNLINLMDCGAIGACHFVCSVYYQAHEKEVCRQLAADLARRGGRFLAGRTHAKLLLAHTTNGQFYVVESSANLRSCRMIEQFALTNSEPLYDFHAGWIDQLINHAQEENED